MRYFDGFQYNNPDKQNPLYDASLNSFDKSGYQSLTNNFSIEWDIIEGLKLRGQLGISSTDNSSDYFLPAEHSYFTSGDKKRNMPRTRDSSVVACIVTEPGKNIVTAGMLR